MPYAAEINRKTPACFIILLDQSGSMNDSLGKGEVPVRKADFLADVVNRNLQNLVVRCSKAEEIRDYFYVAVIGYGLNGGGVASAFAGNLAGQSLVKISDVGMHPARLDNRPKRVPDGAGGLVEQMVRFPIWVDPKAENGTPMCAALQQAHALAAKWVGEHPNDYPPVVLHITDGESGDGDPTPHGKAIMELKSADGNVLLFNCHLSAHRAASIEYPTDATGLPDEFSKTLFNISSPLPPTFLRAAKDCGLSAAEGARGFVFNADANSLVQFFDIGTRPANNQAR